MIVNELKPSLGDNWKEKFTHRDPWDPEGYGVASFDLGGDREKVLVINFKTEDIMEYFYDDLPDDEWISLDRIGEGNYCIQKNYTIKNVKSHYIRNLKTIITQSAIYPQVSLSIQETGWARKVYIHKLVATIFVPNPNPETFNIVNHKDLNKINFSKENLEWCDIMWNAKRENQNTYVLNTKYKRLIDKKEFHGKELEEEYGIKKVGSQVARSIRLGVKYRGSYWEIINVTLEDYLSRHPIDPNGWYDDNGLHDFGEHKVRANSCGVLEVDGKLTVGGKAKNNYYTISISGKTWRVHRLLYEIISNSIISENNIIDHIIPVTREDTNNEFSNLRECTRKENMNNPSTIRNISEASAKRSYLLSQYDLYGNHIKTATYNEFRRLGLKSSGLEERQINLVLTSYNSIWCTHNEDILKFKLSFIYYKLKMNEDGSFTHIDASPRIFSLIKDNRSMERHIRRFLNTGIPAPDGFYYQQGDPQHIIYDPDNKDLVKKKEEIHFTSRRKK